eukprot:101472_1
MVTSTCAGNFALSLVSIQLGLQPFLTEKYISRDGIKTSIIMIQELVKTCCCLIVLMTTGNLFNVFSSWTYESSLRIALIPAIVYCIQNVLAFYAFLQLDPVTYALINQSKMIFAALFLKLILNKTPTIRQMIALSILFISSIMLSLDTINNTNKSLDSIDKNKSYGLICIIIASIMSGLAGTLTQKALQSEKLPRNSILFSIELAFYGVIFSCFRLYFESIFDIFDGTLIAKNGFFHHLETTVLIPITTNAIGGIGCGLITKYTSVIYKSYATICGILLNGIFRLFLYSTPMSNVIYIALPMVMFSLWLNVDTNQYKKQNNNKQNLKKES